MQFGWKKTLIYSLIPMVVFFAGLELAARIVEIWVPPWQVDYGWGFDPDTRLYVPSEDDPGFLVTNPPKEVSFQKERFAMPKPAKCFRVFALGGSSINYIKVNLKLLGLSLNTRFMGKYEFEFIDAGGLAYGSHRLVPVASEIVRNYDPDLILLYCGHNEFEEVEQLAFVQLKTLPLQRILYRSALCRFVRDRLGALQLSAVKRARNQQILSEPKVNFSAGGIYRYTPEDVAERARVYRNNLTIIIELCQSKGIPLIIGTVASNLWKPDLPTEDLRQQVHSLYEQGRYEEGLARAREILRTSPHHQASDTENGIIRELAREYDLPVADVEAAVAAAEPHGVPGETLHSDICHLNFAGNCILVKTYEEQIVRLLKSR